MKKFFILSDIHSNMGLLFNAISKAKFDIKNNDHHMIIVGDILDRGFDGDKVIRFIEYLIQKNRIQAVMGNHDKFIADIIKNNLSLKTVHWNILHNGFIETLQLGLEENIHNLEITNDLLKQIRTGFINKYPIFSKWIVNLPLYLEYTNHVFVHGFLDFELNDWHHTNEKTCIWKRGYDLEVPEHFEKRIIIGHTPNHYINNQDDIIFDGKKIMIDGGAASNRQINIYTLMENEI